MKVISVMGVTDSGKTTTIENIIKELRKRNYTVGTVKEIHFHGFKMDVEGTNTDRHKKAGAQLVTARGEYETDILYQKKLSVNKILSFYDHDFIIMEGVRDTMVPKILTAHDIEGVEDRFDETVFALSGRISSQIDTYKNLPAINAMTHIEKLVDLIEEKGLEFSPNMGNYTDCNEDFISQNIMLKVDDREIALDSSMEKLLQNTIETVIRGLDGYSENGDIKVCIKR